jgi:CO/xanthine dehydrogenase FAD-binding subunit
MATSSSCSLARLPLSEEGLGAAASDLTDVFGPCLPSQEQNVRPFRCVRPKDLEEAIGLLQQHGADARLLAGGTDLIVGLRDGTITPRVVIDIKRAKDLPPLIAKTDGDLTITATVAMSDIEKNDIVRTHFPALAEAAAVVGSIQIRNRATLVGNVCNASPAADTVPVLAVYGAQVKVRSARGERLVPVVDFIQGNRRTVLAAGEVATALHIPLPDRPFGAAFARITRRRGVDLATVNLCCGVDNTGVTTFAFGAVSPRPLLLRDTNGVLADPSAGAEAKAIVLDAMIAKASPITDVRGSAQYRLAMLAVLAKRAQHRAAARLTNGKTHG